MENLRPKPTPFKAGDPQVSAAKLNQLVELALRQVQGGGDVNSRYFGDRLVLESNKQGIQYDQPVYIKKVVVLQEYDDYLYCAGFEEQLPGVNSNQPRPQVYDPNLGKDSIILAYVAKPYDLQRTPWDNQTVVINGVSCTFVYTGIGRRNVLTGIPPYQIITPQELTPNYFPGDVILAVNTATGYTDPRNLSIVWQDLNCGARTFWTGLPSVPAGSSFGPSVSASSSFGPSGPNLSQGGSSSSQNPGNSVVVVTDATCDNGGLTTTYEKLSGVVVINGVSYPLTLTLGNGGS